MTHDHSEKKKHSQICIRRTLNVILCKSLIISEFLCQFTLNAITCVMKVIECNNIQYKINAHNNLSVKHEEFDFAKNSLDAYTPDVPNYHCCIT